MDTISSLILTYHPVLHRATKEIVKIRAVAMYSSNIREAFLISKHFNSKSWRRTLLDDQGQETAGGWGREAASYQLSKHEAKSDNSVVKVCTQVLWSRRTTILGERTHFRNIWCFHERQFLKCIMIM